MSQRIYIAYERTGSDADRALRLWEALWAPTREVFLDVRSVNEGEESAAAPEEALTAATVCLVLLCSADVSGDPQLAADLDILTRRLEQGPLPRVVLLPRRETLLRGIPSRLRPTFASALVVPWADGGELRRVIERLEPMLDRFALERRAGTVAAVPRPPSSDSELSVVEAIRGLGSTAWSLGNGPPASRVPPRAPAPPAPRPRRKARGTASVSASVSISTPRNLAPDEAFSMAWYVHRPAAEELADAHLEQPGNPVVVVGPSRSGKSTFADYLLDTYMAPEDRLVRIDLSSARYRTLAEPDRYLRKVGMEISKQVGLPGEELRAFWVRPFTPPRKLTKFLERRVLRNAEGLLFVVLDKADALKSSPHAAEVFAMLRLWAGLGGQAPWDRLRLILLVSTDPVKLTGKYLNQSPFNLAEPIRLGDLSRKQVESLGEQFGLAWSDREIERLMELAGGNPHMVQRVMFEAAGSPAEALERVLADPTNPDGPFAAHMRAQVEAIRADPRLEHAVIQVLEDEGRGVGREAAEELEAMGVIERDAEGWRLRYRLYEEFLR